MFDILQIYPTDQWALPSATATSLTLAIDIGQLFTLNIILKKGLPNIPDAKKKQRSRRVTRSLFPPCWRTVRLAPYTLAESDVMSMASFRIELLAADAKVATYRQHVALQSPLVVLNGTESLILAL